MPAWRGDDKRVFSVIIVASDAEQEIDAQDVADAILAEFDAKHVKSVGVVPGNDEDAGIVAMSGVSNGTLRSAQRED